MRKNSCRFLSLVLIVILFVGIMPMSVFANSWNTTNAYVENGGVYDLNREYFTFNGPEWKCNNVANMGYAAHVTSTDRSVEFKFTGTGIKLTGFVNCQDHNNDGAAEYVFTNDNVYISIDGGPAQPINITSSTHKVGFYVVYENTSLTEGTHTAIITSAAHISPSAGYDFALQSVSVENGSVQSAIENWNKTYAIENNALNSGYFEFSSNWAHLDAFAEYAFAQTAGDTVSFKFTGTALKVNTLVNYQDLVGNDGVADTSFVNENVYISIDGGDFKKMNLLNASITPGTVGAVYEVKGLNAGTHSVVIKVEDAEVAQANHVFFHSVEVGDGNVIKLSDLPGKIVSAVVTDPQSWQVKVTFTEPVHIFDTGHVWLCDQFSPTPGVNGSYQSGVSSVDYIDPITNSEDSNLYSAEVLITFKPYENFTAIPGNAGIRFVEYLYPDDHNNGTVSSKVIKTYTGKEVLSNCLSGTVDILWENFEFEGNSVYPLYVASTNGNAAEVVFTEPVSVTDATKVLVDGTPVIDVQSKNGESVCNTFVITLPGKATDYNAITFNAESFVDAYNRNIIAKSVYMDPWADPAVDLGEQNTLIVSGEKYNFMNCDTGRSIAVGAEDEFVLTAVAGKTNVYTITNSKGKYIDLSGETPKATDVEQTLLIYPCANERYQIIILGNVVIADDDKGANNNATLAQIGKSENAVIESGWYITKSGRQRPLRIMPFGDSNVYGVNPDLGGGTEVGYRKQLSEKLTEYFGRVVFVGTKRSAVTTIEEKALLRHSGYPGYVAEDVWGNPSHPGIKPLVSGMSLKYDPDIVLLSIGTNDCGLISGNGYTQKEMDEQLVRYENLIKEIEAFMDDNDVLFCDTVTPGANLFINSIKEDHSIGIKSIIERLSACGYKMAVGDNRSTLTAAGINNIIFCYYLL